MQRKYKSDSYDNINKENIVHLHHHIATILHAQHADGLLITNPTNIRYSTGFFGVSHTEIESLVVITQKHIYLIVPQMYSHNAMSLDRVGNNITCIIDDKKDGLLTVASRLLPKSPVIIFEEQHLPTGIYLYIQKKWAATMLPGQGIIEKLRLIKSQQELHEIEHAVQLTDQTMYELIRYLTNKKNRTSVTEIEIAEKIRTIAQQCGGMGMGFDPIVAGGTNTCLPHHIPNQSPLPKHGPLLIDIGVSYHGYTGDLTRTFHIGKPASAFINNYVRVLECNNICIAASKSGVSTSEIQNKALTYFKQYKLDGFFTHAVGHGVGLNIHEDPHFPREKGIRMKENMVVTIEPGVYIPEAYGIRIEDLVVVSKNKTRVLTSDQFKNLYIL